MLCFSDLPEVFGVRRSRAGRCTTPASRLEARTEWPADGVGAALMWLARCAYYLGKGRQILGALGAGPADSRSEA